MFRTKHCDFYFLIYLNFFTQKNTNFKFIIIFFFLLWFMNTYFPHRIYLQSFIQVYPHFIRSIMLPMNLDWIQAITNWKFGHVNPTILLPFASLQEKVARMVRALVTNLSMQPSKEQPSMVSRKAFVVKKQFLTFPLAKITWFYVFDCWNVSIFLRGSNLCFATPSVGWMY